MDWAVVFILLLFMGISPILIESGVEATPFFAENVSKTIQFYGLGIFVFFCVAFFDYKILLKFSLYIYILGIILIIAGMFTRDVNGARGWFELGVAGLKFQPAELMKFCIILYTAHILNKLKGEPLSLKNIAILILVALLPFVIVMLYPDLGNAIIFIIILVGMLWIGNLRAKHAIIGIGIGIVALYSMYFLYNTYHDPITTFLEEQDLEHWTSRIDTFLYPEKVAANDDGWHVNNAMTAIGSAGLFGEGYNQGEFINNGFVPFPYTDSIFVVLAEDFGFIGSSLLLLLYFFFLYRMILIALQSKNRGGSYLVIGIISMYVFQIFINIGMLMDLVPITGITLPFMSYGGTSLLINFMSIGMVMSVKIHQEQNA